MPMPATHKTASAARWMLLMGLLLYLGVGSGTGAEARSVAQQHVEDVAAVLVRLLAVGYRLLDPAGRRDAEPVDHPGTRLDAVGNQMLHLVGRCCMTVDDVAGREARSAEEAETQCQDGGDEGRLHGLLRSLQRLADGTDNAGRNGRRR